MEADAVSLVDELASAEQELPLEKDPQARPAYVDTVPAPTVLQRTYSATSSSVSATPAPAAGPSRELADTSSIYISNLARPFAVHQLRQDLERFGRIDYFWLDGVKSHCYVKVSNFLARLGLLHSLYFG